MINVILLFLSRNFFFCCKFTEFDNQWSFLFAFNNKTLFLLNFYFLFQKTQFESGCLLRTPPSRIRSRHRPRRTIWRLRAAAASWPRGSRTLTTRKCPKWRPEPAERLREAGNTLYKFNRIVLLFQNITKRFYKTIMIW